jgi:hypothetical protein
MGGVAATWMPLVSICNTGLEVNGLQSLLSLKGSLDQKLTATSKNDNDFIDIHAL